MPYSFIPLTLLFVFCGTMYLTTVLDFRYYALIPVLINVLLAIWFVLCERVNPYRADWSKNQGDITTDAFQTFLVLPASSKVAEWVLPFLCYYPLLWLSEPHQYRMALFQESYGLLPVFFICLLCCEFCYYWFHRLMHVVEVLWKFHAVHHGAKRVYWLNAGRFHALEAFFSSLIYFAPLAVLSPDPVVIVWVIAVSSATGFLEHVNVRFKAGFMNYVFNTAELHRWHHSHQMEESNKNYGKVLVIWDQLFGTFYFPKGREVEQAGIGENDVPTDFAGQLKYPFKRSKRSSPKS